MCAAGMTTTVCTNTLNSCTSGFVAIVGARWGVRVSSTAGPQLTAAEALTHATIGVPVRVGKMACLPAIITGLPVHGTFPKVID